MALDRHRIEHVHGSYKESHWFVQPRPYKRPLMFSTMKMKGVTVDNRYPDPKSAVGPGSRLYSTLSYEFAGSPSYEEAYQIAYDRFVGKVKNSVSLGLTVVEAKQSFEMIGHRLKQVVDVYRACRKGNVEQIIKSLGISGKTPRAVRARKRTNNLHNPKRPSYIRDESKRAASTYLEWVFGWKPIIKDIGDAVDTLQKEFPIKPISDGASGVSDQKFGVWPYGSDDFETFLVHTRVGIKAVVKTSNPNLALANELGFVNPAQIAWEVIPFSFLVDWFIPINRFLSSYSDFWGFTIENAFISAKRTAAYHGQWTSSWVSVSTEENGTAFQRRPVSSFPIPGLLNRVKFPKPEFGRAVTMAALVVQVFSGSSR